MDEYVFALNAELLEKIRVNDPGIHTIKFASHDISDIEAEPLAAALKANFTVVVLDFSDCKMSFLGYMSIVASLSNNTTILRVVNPSVTANCINANAINMNFPVQYLKNGQLLLFTRTSLNLSINASLYAMILGLSQYPVIDRAQQGLFTYSVREAEKMMRWCALLYRDEATKNTFFHLCADLNLASLLAFFLLELRNPVRKYPVVINPFKLLNKEGASPLDIASRRGHEQVVQLLESFQRGEPISVLPADRSLDDHKQSERESTLKQLCETQRALIHSLQIQNRKLKAIHVGPDRQQSVDAPLAKDSPLLNPRTIQRGEPISVLPGDRGLDDHKRSERESTLKQLCNTQRALIRSLQIQIRKLKTIHVSPNRQQSESAPLAKDSPLHNPRVTVLKILTQLILSKLITANNETVLHWKSLKNELMRALEERYSDFEKYIVVLDEKKQLADKIVSELLDNDEFVKNIVLQLSALDLAIEGFLEVKTKPLLYPLQP